MMDIKSKLLKSLEDTDLDELTINGLIDVLFDKLAAQKAEIKRLTHANAEEWKRLYDEKEAHEKRVREIQRNPNLLIHLEDYFMNNNGQKFQVRMVNGKLELCEIIKRVAHNLPAVRWEDIYGIN